MEPPADGPTEPPRPRVLPGRALETLPAEWSWRSVTAAVVVVCVALFLVVQAVSRSDHVEALRAAGWVPGDEVWRGRQWALVTSAFVHAELWHAAFNLYWIWRLGPTVERELGGAAFAAFVVGAAFVSSAAELTLTGETGIGASGVGYAIVGALWAGRSRRPAFSVAMPDRLVLLWLAWLGLCFVLTWADVLPVGNAAHVAGLLFGLGIGAGWVARRAVVWTRAAALAGVAAAAVVAVWSPWTANWAAARAIEAELGADVEGAERWYDRYLELGGDRAWALHNLVLLRLSRHDLDGADRRLTALRDLDPRRADEVERSPSWAGARAFEAYLHHDYVGAEDWFRKSLERGGSAAWAQDGIARAQISRGDYEAARKSIDRLRELDPAKADELSELLPH